jgi:hypothetical protein
LLVQYNKETGKNEFPIGSAILNAFSPTRRKANYENMQSDQSRLQDFFSNSMVPEIFGSKSAKEKEDMFKRLQEDMKTEKGRDTASTLYGQAKQNNYDLTDKKNTYGKGLEKFNEAVEKSGNIAQSAAGGISGAFEKIKASGIAAKAGAFAANVGIGLFASALAQLVGWAASKGIDAIKKAATYDKDKIEAADKTRTNYQDKLSDIKSNISTLKGNKTEFESLSKGVDEYGNNISLDTSSYERFLSIRKEILDTTPSLISGYDAEGNAIAKTSGLIDKAIDSQEKKQESAQKKYASDETWDKLVEGNIETVKKASGTRVDKFWGNDMDTLTTQLRNSLQGDKTSQLTTAFNKAAKDVLELPKDQSFDLYKQADMNKFIGSYKQILDKTEDYLPKGTDLSEEIAKISGYAKKYKTGLTKTQKALDQYNQDIATSLPGSITDYSKLGSRAQSFITGLGSNTYNIDTATRDNLKDKDWVKEQRENTIAAAKKFAEDDKAQGALDKFIKSYDKSSNKGVQNWLNNTKDAYDKLKKAATDDGVSIEQLNKSLADSFNVDFKLDDKGNFEGFLKDGKDVQSMIEDIKEKLGDNKDTQSFIDGLNLTEASQAFDILNSKTQVWTGSLDQLKERLKLINQTKSQSTWSDYLQAKETADSGDTYLAMREAFNAQKKERDKGLIGTDDFKTLTSVMSSSGKTDAATFDKTWAKTTKYFTEDNTGLVKFLDDLSAKSKKANSDFGTLKKTAEGSYSGKITNTATAAKSMGMGIEAFEAVLNRLKDYGGKIDFKSVTEQYEKAESTVNELASKWEDMKDGAGKTALGEQIEDYRQEILKLKNAGEDIPDEMVKKLKFEIEIAEDKADYDTAYSKLQGATKVGDKKLTKKYQTQVNQESFEYGSSLIDNVRPTAKKNGYYLKDKDKLEEWETAQYTKLGKLRKNAIEDPSQANYKTLNDFLSKLSETATTIASGKSSLGAYEKAITSKKALNERLNKIAPGTKVNKKNQIQLTGDKEKDSQINSAYKNYNDSAPKGSKKVTTIEVKADTKKAKSDIKETTKPQDKKVTVKTDTKNAKKENKKVTKSENKKITYKADTKDTDKADKKQGKTVSKKIKVRSDYSDAEKKILAWAGVPVDKKGRLIGDISDANQKMLEWAGIKVSKEGKLKGNISDANQKTQEWEHKKVENTAILKANTSQADSTIAGWLRRGVTKVVNVVTRNIGGGGEKKGKAHGTANAHGISFIPRSNALAQGTVDDLTDWYDDEIDGLEEFDAFAHGTVKKLGSRALAMGTTKISDLSQIDPVVQAEKNKYLQEKTDKLKSSVGNAHANGGDWGLKQDERALTGELGDELVV